jgi:hypothetical protein
MARGRNKGSALDPLLAGFAGGAAAFITFAMPDWRFEQTVTLSGLPAILSAAQPPLGTTARLAAMALTGIASFLLVWFVLRALGKPAPKQPRRRSAPVPLQVEPPKLRRADAHPDAPSRRPILAGLDLGRPLDEVSVDQPDPPQEPSTAAAEPIDQEQTAEEEFQAEAPAAPEEVPEEDEGHESHATSHVIEEPEPEEQAERAEPAEPGLTTEPSVSDLMKRLEEGLQRREGTSPSSSASTDPVDIRLRGAIAELQKLTSRGN